MDERGDPVQLWKGNKASIESLLHVIMTYILGKSGKNQQADFIRKTVSKDMYEIFEETSKPADGPSTTTGLEEQSAFSSLFRAPLNGRTSNTQ